MTRHNDSPGCSFVTRPSSPDEVFTPEDFSEEHRMIRDMTAQFVQEEVLPRVGEIESKDWNVTVGLLKRCADLGLLGIEVPAMYGGEDLDKVSAMIVSEQLAHVSSFFVSHGGHTGIGTLPIVYFGSEEQKRRYLPAFCKGDKISAYALSEASSGSDALAAKATATLDDATGNWLLNGEKMWITNAGFADVFITFAQAQGKDFSCFIVEKDFPGVSTGAEEHKMGLRGSSTRALILQNVRVPASNLIGQQGKGHRVAFNILNTGRAKLGAGAVGSGVTALNDAIQYSKERRAFGRAIAGFGAIQHKLADMAVRLWVTEGMVYRTAGSMDRSLSAVDATDPDHALKAIEEYAVECSALKVYGTEVLDFCVDEAVQIYGGYGYSAEYAVERYYRDSRVNRIFEGTNEINRLLIPTMLLKRDAAGSIPIRTAASSVDLSERRPDFEDPSGVLEASRRVLLVLVARAMELYGEKLREEQELLAHLADITMHVFAMDTAVARSRKPRADEVQKVTALTAIQDGATRVEFASMQVASRLRNTSLSAQLRWLFDGPRPDTIEMRRRIASHLLDRGAFGF